MPVDPSPLLACAGVWRPSKGWGPHIRDSIVALEGGATGLEASKAWCTLAMMAGDTRGAPLALIVCLHAEASLPEGVVDTQIAAHRDLCLMELGIAAPPPGPIPLVDFGKPGMMQHSPGQLAAWLARALIPFDGDLSRAATYVRKLAALRTGLVDGPDPEP